MNKQTEALRMAKQHIIERKGGRGGAVCYVKTDKDIIKAIDEALEQPAQEPVAWMYFDEAYKKACNSSQPQDWMDAALMAQQVRCAHPAPSWQGLDAVEVSNIFISKEVNGDATQFARAIEQALRSKNDR